MERPIIWGPSMEKIRASMPKSRKALSSSWIRAFSTWASASTTLPIRRPPSRPMRWRTTSRALVTSMTSTTRLRGASPYR